MEQIIAMRNAARLQAFFALIIVCTGERNMRKYLLAASAVAALAAAPTAASAQYYYDGYAPPGAAYVDPPAVYAAPPMAESASASHQRFCRPTPGGRRASKC